MNNRDTGIDILRFIGLSCIILAHVNAPLCLKQMRCFDVPLMLFVSGLTCSGKSFPNYSTFIIKRAKRLLIPTWGFLLVWMGALFCVESVIGKPLMSWDFIWKSFAMIGGIGYVWIIRVFLLVAFLTPLLERIEKKLKPDWLLIGSMIIWGGILEVLIVSEKALMDSSLETGIINDFVITTIAYSLFFILGIRMRYISNVRNLRMSIIFTLILIFSLGVYLFTLGAPVIISPTFKYPPHSYYILYGFFACSWLWGAKEKLSKILKNRLSLFIARNTIWIYLYHIILLSVPMPVNWVVRYIVVYGGALFLFAIQYGVYLKIKDKFAFSKYLIG